MCRTNTPLFVSMEGKPYGMVYMIHMSVLVIRNFIYVHELIYRVYFQNDGVSIYFLENFLKIYMSFSF